MVGIAKSDTPTLPSKKVPNNTIKTVEYDTLGRKVVVKTHPVLDNTRTGSALKIDAYHAFNDLIDNFAEYATTFDLLGNDKSGIVRKIYQIEGSLDGVNGIFEWIVDPRPQFGVTHRMFIKEGKISGIPNKFGTKQ